MRDYETLGSAVTRGGEHADDLTRNALIPFKGGSYLELVAFLNPTILGITSGAGGRSTSPAVVLSTTAQPPTISGRTCGGSKILASTWKAPPVPDGDYPTARRS
jgi:hypothetical protein